MKLLGLGSTENNGENVPHLEIAEVVLVHCHIVNICIHLFLINYLVVY